MSRVYPGSIRGTGWDARARGADDKLYGNAVTALLCTLAVTVLWFAATWRFGFDMADEGFYWYGAQRTLRGEVPLRDFMSYDIARYYWAAWFMSLMGGDGLYPARVAAAVFMAFGVSVGVYLCLLFWHGQGVAKYVYGTTVALTLTIWHFPYYKSYDHAASLMVVGALFMALKSKYALGWILSGMVLGVAATIGRNHGLYAAVAVFLMLVVGARKGMIDAPLPKALGFLLLGGMLGFLPSFLMMGLVDGFLAAFVESIRVLFSEGATNLPLPVPWPWLTQRNGLNLRLTTASVVVGFGFIALLVVPVVSLGMLLWDRVREGDARKVLLAATAAAVPYAHYAFSRADAIHLALAIFPTLIILFGAVSRSGWKRGLVGSAFLLAVSVFPAARHQPYISAKVFGATFVSHAIRDDQVFLRRHVYERFAAAQEAVVAPDDGSVRRFVAVPDMPSLHAVYGMPMPIWEIYTLFKRDAEFEQAELARMKAYDPEVVIVSDVALDGRRELRYSNLRPEIVRWLEGNFNSIDVGVKHGGFKAGELTAYSKVK